MSAEAIAFCLGLKATANVGVSPLFDQHELISALYFDRLYLDSLFV
jgi:hypothetical protein